MTRVILLEHLPVKERIPHYSIAIMCLKALIRVHKFDVEEEKVFKEDCQYSIKLLEKLLGKYEL